MGKENFEDTVVKLLMDIVEQQNDMQKAIDLLLQKAEKEKEK